MENEERRCFKVAIAAQSFDCRYGLNFLCENVLCAGIKSIPVHFYSPLQGSALAWANYRIVPNSEKSYEQNHAFPYV